VLLVDVAVAFVLGQADAASTFDELKTWGPAGVMLAMVLSGLLVPKYVIDRLDRQLQKVEAQRDAFAAQATEMIPVLAKVNETMIPSLNRSADAKEALVREVTAMRAEMTEMRAELRRLGDRAGS
jgi:hypothetical protein